MKKYYETYLTICACAVLLLGIDLYFPFLGPCQFLCKILFGSFLISVHLKLIVSAIAPKILKSY